MENMAGFLFTSRALALLMFLNWPSGSSSQPVLTQQPSASFSSGENVHLTCVMSSGYRISDHRVHWYQQTSGGVPRFLYHYYISSDQGRGSGVPERFSVSPDASNNLRKLVITGVQPVDEGDYYCGTWDSNSSVYHGGNFEGEMSRKA
uniref:Immunoglobulin lambda variable 11-55 (non-functional) n=1 Tax=Anolis carolinensis TaxID=28377 RepID=R4GC90_ANOCA